jgi:hypothetical protein
MSKQFVLEWKIEKDEEERFDVVEFLYSWLCERRIRLSMKI